MELGQRIKAARLEKGLSQRQLCGERITRNMLSQIESGSARPSMDTLRYLASALGKSVSFFLEEDAVTSPNQPCMVCARKAYEKGDFAGVLAALEDFREPDESFSQERTLLQYLALLSLAEMAVQEGRLPYAGRLLERAEALEGMYIDTQLRAKAAVLAAKARGSGELPNVDAVLLLRAASALDAGAVALAGALLDSVENPAGHWHLLRGRVCMANKEFARAKAVLEGFEGREAWPLLEICCRELGDFQGAYQYACRQREKS